MTVRNEQPAMLAVGDDYDDFDDLLDASSLGAPHVVAARQDLPESMREHLRAAAAAARNTPQAPPRPGSDAAHRDARSGLVRVDTSPSVSSSAAPRTIVPGVRAAAVDFGTSASTAAVWDPPQPAEVRIALWGTARPGKSTLLNALLGAHHGLLPPDVGDSSAPTGLQVVDLPGLESTAAQLERMQRGGACLDPWSVQNREAFAWMRHLRQTWDGTLPIIVFGADTVTVPPLVGLLFSPDPRAGVAAVSGHPPCMARDEWIPAGTGGHGLRMALSLMRRGYSRVLREGWAACGAAHDTAAAVWHHLARTAPAAGPWSTALGMLSSECHRWGGLPSAGTAGTPWTGLGTVPVAAYLVSIDDFPGYLPRPGTGVLALCPAGQGNWPNVREGTLPWDESSAARASFGGGGRWARAAQLRVRSAGGVGAFGSLSRADAVEREIDAAVALLLLLSSPTAVGTRARQTKGEAQAVQGIAPPQATGQQVSSWRAWQPGAPPGPGELWGRAWQETAAHPLPDLAAYGRRLLPPGPAFVCALLVSVPGSYRWPAAGVPPELQPQESHDQDQNHEQEEGEGEGELRGKFTRAEARGDVGRSRAPTQRRPSLLGTDARTRRPRDVHRDLKAWLLNENGHTEGIPIRLTYTAADPYVVCLIFRTSRGQVVWNLARELLSQALDRRAGTGDVIAWSQDDEHLAPEERSTFLLLRPAGRLALLGVSREQLRAFLAQTWRAVASGAEYDLCMLALADIEQELHTAVWTPDNG